MKKHLKIQNKNYYSLIAISFLFNACLSKPIDYNRKYLEGAYTYIYNETSNYDIMNINSLELIVFSASKYKKFYNDTSGMQFNRFSNIFINQIMFDNQSCDSSTFFKEGYVIIPLDSFPFNQHRALDLFDFALTYEFYHKCDIEVKDKFLRESLIRDSTIFVAIFELGKTALAGGKYNEALFLFEYVLKNYGYTEYLEKCKNYVISKGANAKDILSLEMLLKSPIAIEYVDSSYYTKYF